MGAYTLVSASIYTGSTQLFKVGSGTTITTPLTTSGSQLYRLELTGSLNGSFSYTSTLLPLNLSKTLPGSPTITATPTVQLGASSNQIEQGATGSISFVSASGAANGWVLNYVTSSVKSPLIVTGSLTGSSSIIISATSSYSSSGVNGSDNSPALVTSSFASTTYTKIRSLRYGATTDDITTQVQLENIGYWTGNVGSIDKGTTNPSGQTISITWTGDKYQYIVYNKSAGLLSSIKAAGVYEVKDTTFGGVPYITTTDYYIYKSTLQTWNGSPQTYLLTI
jgi:hypothetical protein